LERGEKNRSGVNRVRQKSPFFINLGGKRKGQGLKMPGAAQGKRESNVKFKPNKGSQKKKNKKRQTLALAGLAQNES